MKLRLKGLIVLSVISCNQPSTQFESGKPGNSLNKENYTKMPPAKIVQRQTKYIYQQYIPASVHDLLEKQLPGWKLPEPDKWENFWFNHYRNDSSLINYAFGDFNGDLRRDYAFILQKDTSDIAIWILQSYKDIYQAIKLLHYKDIRQSLDLGIETVPAGKLNYIDFDADDVKSLKLKFPGIRALYFERGAETFYWNQNLYKSVITAD